MRTGAGSGFDSVVFEINPDQWNRGWLLAIYPVGVEKVTSISGMRFSGSMVEESDLTHALLDSHHRRTADHDGATRPLRSAVLLLPTGRSDSRDSPAAAHR